MEKELSTHQERLLELLASKSFSSLNSEERAFVVTQISEKEYELQHEILTSAEKLDEQVPTPIPLVLEDKKSVFLTPVPLYQSLIGIVAAAAVLFFILPSKTIETVTFSKPVAQIDTVYLEKEIIDTVVKVEYRDRIVERRNTKPQMNQTNYVSLDNTPNPMGASQPASPEITELAVRNRGTSAKNDATLSLIEDFSFVRPKE